MGGEGNARTSAWPSSAGFDDQVRVASCRASTTLGKPRRASERKARPAAVRVLLLWSPASQALLSFFSESRDYAFIGTNRERPALPLRVLVSLGHVDKPSGSLVSVGSGLFDMA
jgi:hypothetical protein